MLQICFGVQWTVALQKVGQYVFLQRRMFSQMIPATSLVEAF